MAMSRPNNAPVTPQNVLSNTTVTPRDLIPDTRYPKGYVPSFANAQDGRAAPKRTPTEQAAVVASVARVLTAMGAPPLDRGGKSILAQQVRNLLRGGWPVGEIEATAKDLAGRYDRYHGHKMLTQLQRVMERGDEDRQAKEHTDGKPEFERIALEAAANLRAQGITNPAIERVFQRATAAERAKRHPNAHPFMPESDDRESCSVCGGPVGVHVRRGAA
jgi:hypothetical protein